MTFRRIPRHQEDDKLPFECAVIAIEAKKSSLFIETDRQWRAASLLRLVMTTRLPRMYRSAIAIETKHSMSAGHRRKDKY
ncbi:MAG: hypothetical protein LBM75_03525 [Myxococcales bacterium]|jgi:hypothetical protein|nr:hypothetical protein [Myxococcales bacterium]